MDRLEIDERGDLVLRMAAGDLRQHRPLVYQTIGGRRSEIPASYVLRGRLAASIVLGTYDREREVVVDPILSYATYAGGTKTDSAFAIAVDGAANMYVVGRTSSQDFPATAQAFQKTNSAPWDLFVMKLDSKGAVVYATYLGGKSNDIPAGIGVDRLGNVWLAGYTDSIDFPMTAKSYQGTNRGGYYGFDGFIAKLDATGANLLYSSYLGGNNDELIMGLAVDAQGAVYVDGLSASSNFPVTLSAYQKTNRYANAFVAKFTAEGNLDYSTFVGGSKSDVPGSIAVDSSGNVYVVGDTASADFPTTANAVQPSNRGGISDVFVFKLNPQGSQLLYSTLLGSSDVETGYGVAADAAGNVYICGKTASTSFPVTANALKRDLSGPSDAFVAKIDTVAGKLMFSTLLGGSRDDTAFGIAADSAGNSYVAGMTTSTNFPTAAPFQSSAGGATDAFVVKLDPTGSKVLDGSLLGGSGEDSVIGMAFDGTATAYLAGDTDSADFPVSKANASQKTYGGGNADAYIAKVTFSNDLFNLAVGPEKLSAQCLSKGAVTRLALGITAAQGMATAWTAEAASMGGSWLSVTPKSGTGSATLDVVIDPAALAAGAYTGSVSVVNQVTSARIVVPVGLTVVVPAGQIGQNALVNAASTLGGAVAPGEVVVLSGGGIGPDAMVRTSANADEAMPTLAGETRVLFDGIAAPLMYVSAGKTGAIVPYDLAGKETTQVQVEYRGVKSNTLAVPVAACAPGMYTVDPSGKGPAAVTNEDGTPNSAENPALKGSVVTLFATGEGQTDPPGVNGKIARSVFPKPVLPVALRIGELDAELLYFGAVPNAPAGFLQINARIPVDVTAGEQSVVLAVGNCSSQPEVTVSVQ